MGSQAPVSVETNPTDTRIPNSRSISNRKSKSSAGVKATPNPEPVPNKVAVNEKPSQVESKAKAVAADERAKSVSKTDTVKNPNYIYIGQRLTIPPDERTGT